MKSIRIKYLLPILAAVLIAIFNTNYATDGESRLPNVVFIFVGDLGYGDVNCFNPEGKILTPNLDKMAENGVMFTDAHTTSAVCTPTRYGIITGRYNWRTSLKSFVLSGYSKSLIKQERTTIAEMLKAQGYTTAYVGKWHLGWDWELENEEARNLDKLNARPEVNFDAPVKNGPSTHGFDYSFGFCGSLDMAPYVYVENDMPTMVPTKTTVSVDEKGIWRKGLTSDDFVHVNMLQDLTDKAVDYITKKANAESPFFLYFPLPAPHTPILPTTEFMGKSNTNMYGDFVMQVDDVVRQIRETLKSQGISENTLLVFTSDNGCSPKADFEELAKVDHDPSYVFRGTKADIFEGGHHVPFIVEWPNEGLKNISSDKTICTTDFFATCAELTGYQIQDTEAEDSYSLLSLIKGKSDSEIREYIVHHSINGSFAIRQGDWKFIHYYEDGRKELYNLAENISETTDLAAKYPERVEKMGKELFDYLTEVGAKYPTPDPEYSEAAQKNICISSNTKKCRRWKNNGWNFCQKILIPVTIDGAVRLPLTKINMNINNQ